ncbi:3-dehydroquinate synthase [Enterovirga sp.]|uniref:3-dehydroquinate synthase n=1 Tax=Enterovirga sp. TaxID=2026350 RepID=UPI002CBFDEE4|nr:3-dehydroquinate synthase [Enterovirga sp.]HMO28411.1 3-dehydroquinate synthase [Enterovirga sp.]
MEKVLPDVSAPPGVPEIPARFRQGLVARLRDRSIVLVGLMGAGKTTIGRRLAARLGLPFRDADQEIEAAAAMSIPDIFKIYGEAAFRDLEKRVLARLLQENGQIVLATGGGAFMNADIRDHVRSRGVSIWLRADLPTLMKRVRRRSNRPLLRTDDPEGTMRRLMDERYPVYALADVTVDSLDASHDKVTQDVMDHLTSHLLVERPPAERAPARANPASQVVHVPLGDRAYDILVGRGVLETAAPRLGALGARAAAVVSDEHVAKLHGEALDAVLAAAGLRVAHVTVPAGEGSKSFAQLERVSNALLEAKIERGDLVVALGGGVVGDLAGFAAAILRRGVRLVQAPTSLLAQVDSSVGGKTGINAPAGKNLIGAFHQPSLVLADTALLDTLPVRELRAGYAEVVKYGLIDDADFFAWCEAHGGAILAGGPERDHAVAVSCRAKAAVVVEDEREEGRRALLNLGHTFAHALERIVAYDGARLVHGEAVAIGLALAFRFSAALGLCAEAEAERVRRHLAAMGMPASLAEVPGGFGTPEAILDAMGQDKKVKAGRLTFILARGIGRAFIAEGVPSGDVLDFLRREAASG